MTLQLEVFMKRKPEPMPMEMGMRVTGPGLPGPLTVRVMTRGVRGGEPFFDIMLGTTLYGSVSSAADRVRKDVKNLPTPIMKELFQIFLDGVEQLFNKYGAHPPLFREVAAQQDADIPAHLDQEVLEELRGLYDLQRAAPVPRES